MKTFELTAAKLLPGIDHFGKDAAVTASTQDVYYNAQNVKDGDLETYWISAAKDVMPTVTYVFNEPIVFNEVSLYENGDSVTGYQIQVSDDGVRWSDIYKGEKIGEHQIVTVDATVTRYLRIVVTSKKEQTVSLFEFAPMLSGGIKSEVDAAAKALEIGEIDYNKMSIELPNEAKFGCSVSWQSENPQIISNKGEVTLPSSAQKVTLTATVSKEDVTATKKFTVSVKGKSTGSGGSGGSSGSGSMSTITTPEITQQNTDSSNSENTDNEDKVVFKDIQDHWAEDYIYELYYAKAVTGVSDDLFEPDRFITREEFAKMVAGYFDLQGGADEMNFKDVPENMWFAEPIEILVSNDIINGISDELFGVGNNLTREDMCVILYRLINNQDILVQSGNKTEFSDFDQISDYAKDAVELLSSAGVISGYDGDFRPKMFTTRAEVCKVLSVVKNYSEK